jgi:hypothetical protein
MGLNFLKPYKRTTVSSHSALSGHSKPLSFCFAISPNRLFAAFAGVVGGCSGGHTLYALVRGEDFVQHMLVSSAGGEHILKYGLRNIARVLRALTKKVA